MLKCWGWTELPGSGVTQRNADLLHFDPGTWPWRVGCQTIAPEPQLVRCHITLLAAATRPKATEDTAACVCVKSLSLTMQQSLTLSEAGGCCLSSCWLSKKWDNSRRLSYFNFLHRRLLRVRVEEKLIFIITIWQIYTESTSRTPLICF